MEEIRSKKKIVHEKIPVKVYNDSEEASKAVAHEIALLIKRKKTEGWACVLGLATGTTPKSVYKELIRLHREEGLSFQHVVS